MDRKPLFEGAATALITPFKNGGVDYEKLEIQIAYQLDQGIDALVVTGTTGEACTLSDSEHLETIAVAVRTAGGRVPVIAGTGSNDTAYAILLSQSAQKAGANMVLMVPPYYNMTTQRGLVKHFSMIAQHIDIPIMLYNIPQRTGMNIAPATMAELSRIPNITAVKECNIAQLGDCFSLCEKDFAVYSGDDANILTVLAFGGKGVISVLGNLLPMDIHNLVNLFLRNRIQESRDLFYRLHPLMKALFLETNPIPVKKAMELMGRDRGLLRMPLMEMSQEHAETLRTVMDGLGLLRGTKL